MESMFKFKSKAMSSSCKKSYDVAGIKLADARVNRKKIAEALPYKLL